MTGGNLYFFFPLRRSVIFFLFNFFIRVHDAMTSDVFINALFLVPFGLNQGPGIHNERGFPLNDHAGNDVSSERTHPFRLIKPLLIAGPV